MFSQVTIPLLEQKGSIQQNLVLQLLHTRGGTFYRLLCCRVCVLSARRAGRNLDHVSSKSKPIAALTD